MLEFAAFCFIVSALFAGGNYRRSKKEGKY
jgi:hypothetical protein